MDDQSPGIDTDESTPNYGACAGCGKDVKSILKHLAKTTNPKCNQLYDDDWGTKKNLQGQSALLKRLRDKNNLAAMRSDSSYKADENAREKKRLEEQKSLRQDFICDLCDKKFSLQKNLDCHVKTVHLEERRFSCSKCPETFSTHYNLKTHMGLGKHSFTITCE